MILTLFLSLLALATIVVMLGYFTNDEPYLPVGLFFFFLLGLAILNGQLQYQAGDQRNTTFSYNGSVTTAQAQTTTYTYTTWNDTTSHWTGWTLTVMSMAGFVLAIINISRRSGEEIG